MAQKEAKARIKINQLLEEAGWRFFDTGEARANIALEHHTKVSTTQLNDLGENFEQVKNGFLDFLLLDERGFPLVVLEAKAEHIHPLTAKEQARKYAVSQNCRYIILSNGNLHSITALLPNSKVLPEFLNLMLIINRERWKDVAKSTRKDPNITKSHVLEFKIPLPPIETQQRIVADIEREQTLVNANKELITLFEQKIKDRIAAVWGKPESPGIELSAKQEVEETVGRMVMYPTVDEELALME